MVHAVSEVASGEYITKPHRILNEPPQLKVAIDILVEKIESLYPQLPNARWVAQRLLDGDERISEALYKGELGDLRSAQVGAAGQGMEIELEALQ